ncbi:MAG: DUF4215 domain-containing protein [Myxococcota bacterium]
MPRGNDPTVDISVIHSSGTTETGESVISARYSDVRHRLTVAGEVLWEGNGGNNPQFNSTGLPSEVRSAERFAVHVREPELPSYGFRVETADGIIATETTPIAELDGFAPTEFDAMRWAGDDSLLLVVHGPSAADPVSRGILLASDGTPGSMQWLLGPGDVADGRTVLSVRDRLAASSDGSHRMVVFDDTDEVAHVLVDDTIVADEDVDIPGLDLPWGRTETIAINSLGQYAHGGGHPINDVLQYVAVDGELEVTGDDTIDGVDLATARIVDIALDDRSRLTHLWRFVDEDPDTETLMYSCNAGQAGTTSRLLVQTGDVITLTGELGGSITVLGFADRYMANMLGDPDAIVVQVEGLLDGEEVDATVRLPIACCGNGDVDPAEACDDANDVDTDACLSTCEAATCGDGFVHETVEACDDGNRDDTDACTSACVEARCGDGLVWEGVEGCDDGNEESGDGCSSTCQVEPDEDSGSEGGVDDDGDGTDGGSATGGDDGADGPGDDGTGDGTGGDAGATDSGGGCRIAAEEAPRSWAWLFLLAGGAFVRRRR